MVPRLKSILDKIIDSFQSAFAKGRNISNNYIIAHVILHSFRKKNIKNMMGLKLDMSIVYDRTERDFILGVLGAFAFHNAFIQIVKGSTFGNFYSL